MNTPWTYEELQQMLGTVTKQIEISEAENPNARPVLPLSEEEAFGLIFKLVGLAEARALTGDEVFLFGQLIANYRMSVEARMLGRKGRYFVISEAQLEKLKP